MKSAATKPIYEITPFTTLDYFGSLACIVWFAGCNMRCPYCYNPNIVLENGKISLDELFTFLKKRVGLLEGVVLSGGECTNFSALEFTCKEIKKLGFKIKIDTNGSKPEVLKSLISQNLVDFVALDFKAPQGLFKKVTLSNFYEKTLNSLQILQNGPISFEVRTTVHKDLLDENAINEIVNVLHVNDYKGTYYLQNFLHVKTLGELVEQTKLIDKNQLSKKIPIEFRNF
ncbi:MAG: anaerobic ribonucleoside-triphosphate reductase activating protein [Campylobacteraceae bacterium]